MADDFARQLLDALYNPEQQPPQQPSRPFREKLIGAAEAAATLGTGLLSSIPAGYAGLSALMPTRAGSQGDLREAAKRVQNVQGALTYVPRTETGQQYLERTAEALEPLSVPAKYIGDIAQRVTGSPVAGGVAETLGDPINLVGTGIPTKMAKAGVQAAKMAPKIPGALLDLAMSGPPSGSLAAQRGAFAFHGTPYKFAPTERNPLGEFDPTKIGSGEGAQAFGHGLYLAENPEVAKDYRYMLSKIEPENVTYGGRSAESMYNSALAEQDRAHRTNNRDAIDQANAKLAFWEGIMTRRHPEDVIRMANSQEDGWPTFAKYANSIDLNKFKGAENAGSLYKVDVPDEVVAKMLDWDKPWEKQSKEVKEALKSSGIWKAYKENLSDFSSPMGTRNRMMRGQNIHEFVSYISGGDQVKAAQKLRELGIPGIKYLDEGSREKGRGTRNLVIFPGEEKSLNIVERKKEGGSVRVSDNPDTMRLELRKGRAVKKADGGGIDRLTPKEKIFLYSQSDFSKMKPQQQFEALQNMGDLELKKRMAGQMAKGGKVKVTDNLDTMRLAVQKRK